MASGLTGGFGKWQQRLCGTVTGQPRHRPSLPDESFVRCERPHPDTVCGSDQNGRQLGYAALAAIESGSPAGTQFAYQGPVISGATIGVWKHQPLDAAARLRAAQWGHHRWTVDLPYRQGLPSETEIRDQHAQWTQTEQSAREAGDNVKAADARAMVERMNRWLTRLAGLPGNKSFPFPVTLWHVGSAVWIAVEGEPYNLLQRELRRRFPELAIIVMVLANGSRAWYLPTEETYGKGIYQESMANLEPGCLETLIENIAEQLQKL